MPGTVAKLSPRMSSPKKPRFLALLSNHQFKDVVVARSGTPLYIYRYHTQNIWEEPHIMGILASQYNRIELGAKSRKWLVWSLISLPLRY
jgi:hypothetical protein